MQWAETAPGSCAVSKDINLRIKADAVGLRSVNDKVSIEDLYSGFREISTGGTIKILRQDELPVEAVTDPTDSLSRPMKTLHWWISTTTAIPCWPGTKPTATRSNRCNG